MFHYVSVFRSLAETDYPLVYCFQWASLLANYNFPLNTMCHSAAFQSVQRWASHLSRSMYFFAWFVCILERCVKNDTLLNWVGMQSDEWEMALYRTHFHLMRNVKVNVRLYENERHDNKHEFSASVSDAWDPSQTVCHIQHGSLSYCTVSEPLNTEMNSLKRIRFHGICAVYCHSFFGIIWWKYRKNQSFIRFPRWIYFCSGFRFDFRMLYAFADVVQTWKNAIKIISFISALLRRKKQWRFAAWIVCE